MPTLVTLTTGDHSGDVVVSAPRCAPAQHVSACPPPTPAAGLPPSKPLDEFRKHNVGGGGPTPQPQQQPPSTSRVLDFQPPSPATRVHQHSNSGDTRWMRVVRAASSTFGEYSTSTRDPPLARGSRRMHGQSSPLVAENSATATRKCAPPPPAPPPSPPQAAMDGDKRATPTQSAPAPEVTSPPPPPQQQHTHARSTTKPSGRCVVADGRGTMADPTTTRPPLAAEPPAAPPADRRTRTLQTLLESMTASEIMIGELEPWNEERMDVFHAFHQAQGRKLGVGKREDAFRQTLHSGPTGLSTFGADGVGAGVSAGGEPAVGAERRETGTTNLGVDRVSIGEVDRADTVVVSPPGGTPPAPPAAAPTTATAPVPVRTIAEPPSHPLARHGYTTHVNPRRAPPPAPPPSRRAALEASSSSSMLLVATNPQPSQAASVAAAAAPPPAPTIPASYRDGYLPDIRLPLRLNFITPKKNPDGTDRTDDGIESDDPDDDTTAAPLAIEIPRAPTDDPYSLPLRHHLPQEPTTPPATADPAHHNSPAARPTPAGGSGASTLQSAAAAAEFEGVAAPSRWRQQRLVATLTIKELKKIFPPLMKQAAGRKRVTGTVGRGAAGGVGAARDEIKRSMRVGPTYHHPLLSKYGELLPKAQVRLGVLGWL
ncbi:hypothetical protein BDK51DRAFT_46126 [Blyttiomyces helicus]|uniref:Uncharacterized protein n=1 Tax=Blyttiomyces helicus TaxID=388810 RepID=A0A4P9WFK3_9FUNG|nr:hypothetical protein BDK51DRAFT_46126 [Blyttiomyces helicus]|eukprot:RKO91541.1 hypothetical protein BDK51DRAFT_46126 [Blyttiomyces helicus]